MENIRIDNLDDVSFLKLDACKYSSKDELVNLYWLFHPRFKFFKTLKCNSKLLDIGAASGGLIFWKQWGYPNRNDIQMYAIDRSKGEFFDKYVDFQVLDLDKSKIKYENEFFDVIFLSHVIEHLENYEQIVKESWRLLKKGGRIYVETPTPETINFPSKSSFLLKGIKTTTINFFDDNTHLKALNNENLRKLLESQNFEIVESGLINNEFLEDELFTYGFNHGDEDLTTFAVWSKLHWAHYVVASKPKETP